MAVEPAKGSERGVVEHCPHAEAYHQPRHNIRGHIGSDRQTDLAEPDASGAESQCVAAAMPFD